MQRSFRSRLEALERLEAVPTVDRPPPPPPPTFDAALAGVALFRAALADGRAKVCSSVYTWQNGAPVSGAHLCHMPDPEVCYWGVRISGWRARLGGGEFATVGEWDAWLAAVGRAVAFWMSRTVAEVEAATTLADDSLFWTLEQQALVGAWAQMVEQGNDDAQLS